MEESNKESTQKKETQLNLKHTAERFMIERFICKHSNAKQWLETFEKECRRFEISEDNTRIEILRLFLDKSCLDWHSATLTTLTMEAGWKLIGKKHFWSRLRTEDGVQAFTLYLIYIKKVL